MTVRSNEHYRNYYNFFYRCEDGKVAEYWEYLDTKYAARAVGRRRRVTMQKLPFQAG